MAHQMPLAGAVHHITEIPATEIPERGGSRRPEMLRHSSLLGVLILVAVTMFGSPSVEANDEKRDALLLNADTVSAVVAASRNEAGYIRRVRNRIGFFFFDFDINKKEDDQFSKSISFEAQLLASVVPIASVVGRRYPLSTDASEIVVLRSVGDDKVSLLERDIPETRNIIESNKSALASNACVFLNSEDRDRPERIPTAYLFVGRDLNAVDAGDCLHRLFLRAFGVVERPMDGISIPDKFLSEVIALRILDICSDEDVAGQKSCVERELSKLK